MRTSSIILLFCFSVVCLTKAQVSIKSENGKYVLYDVQKTRINKVFDTILSYRAGLKTSTKLFVGIKADSIGYSSCGESAFGGHKAPNYINPVYSIFDANGKNYGDYNDILLRNVDSTGNAINFTSFSSLSQSWCNRHLYFNSNVIFDRVYNNLICKSNGKWKLLYVKNDSLIQLSSSYDSISEYNEWSRPFFECALNGKYDCLTKEVKQLNQSPLDTIFKFHRSIVSEWEYYLKPKLLVFLSESEKHCLSYPDSLYQIEIDSIGNEIEVLRCVYHSIPFHKGGKMQLLDSNLNTFETEVKELALLLNVTDREDAIERYFLKKLSDAPDTSTRVGQRMTRYDFGFSRTPIICLKKNDNWQVMNLDHSGKRLNSSIFPKIELFYDLIGIKLSKDCGFYDTLLNKIISLQITELNGIHYLDNHIDSLINKHTNYYRVLGKNGMGLIDRRANIVVPMEFKEITSENDKLIVIKGGIKKYLSVSDSVDKLDYDVYGNETISRVKVERLDSFYTEEKWGLYDINGNCLLKPEYDFIYFSYKLNSYITIKGGKARNITEPYQSKYYKTFETASEYYEKPEGGEMELYTIDMKKRNLPSGEYQFYKEFSINDSTVRFFHFIQNNKFGLVDGDLNQILPCEYEAIEITRGNDEEWILKLKRNGKWARTDFQDYKEAQFDSDYLEAGKDFNITGNRAFTSTRSKNNLVNYAYVFKDGKGAIDNLHGVKVNELDSIVAPFLDYNDSPSRYFLIYKKGKIGLFTLRYKEIKSVIFPQYDKVNNLYDDYYEVIANNKHGLYNAGELILPLVFDSIVMPDRTFQALKKNQGWGIYSKEGAELQAPQFDSIYNPWLPHYDGGKCLFVKSGGKYGIASTTQNSMIAEPVFDELSLDIVHPQYNLIIGKKKGKCELFNAFTEKKVLPFSFTKIDCLPLTNNCYRVYVDSLVGLMDSSLTMIFDIKYKAINWSDDMELYCLIGADTTYRNKSLKVVPKGAMLWKKSVINKLSLSCSGKLSNFKWESTNGPFGCDATAFYKDELNTWWLGTGSSGGIFCSSDEGKTWVERNDGLGPRHIWYINKINDTIFAAASLPGDYVFAYPSSSGKSFEAIYFYEPNHKKWHRFDSTKWHEKHAQLQALKESEDEKVFKRFRYNVEEYSATWNDYVKGCFLLDSIGHDVDTLVLNYPLDNTGFFKLDDYNLLLLNRSGLYRVNFKTSKIEKCATTGLNATDITYVHPFSNGEVLVCSGTHAFWKYKSNKWQLIGDSYLNNWSEYATSNNISFDNINFNKKEEGLFTAEGAVFTIKNKGEFIKKEYQPKKSGFDFEDPIRIKAAGWLNDKQWAMFAENFSAQFRTLAKYDFTKNKVLGNYESYKSSEYTNCINASNGDVWVYDWSKLTKIGDSIRSTLTSDFLPSTNQYNSIHKVFTLTNGDLIMASNFGPYYYWSNASAKWARLPINVKEEISTLCMDKFGRLFLATNYKYIPGGCGSDNIYEGPAKLYYFSVEDGNLNPIEIENPVNPRIISLAPHPQGGVWVGTCGSGLWRLDYSSVK